MAVSQVNMSPLLTDLHFTGTSRLSTTPTPSLSLCYAASVQKPRKTVFPREDQQRSVNVVWQSIAEPSLM